MVIARRPETRDGLQLTAIREYRPGGPNPTLRSGAALATAPLVVQRLAQPGATHRQRQAFLG